jgi:hypothetical protein
VAADAALGGAPLLGVAPVQPTTAELLRALAQGQLQALAVGSGPAHASSSNMGGVRFPSSSQALHFQAISAVSLVYEPEFFR